MSRWRDPRPGEWRVVLDRWQIESGPWDLYEDLCHWPNTYDQGTEQVTWIVPEPEWMLLVLRHPHARPYGERYEDDKN